MTETNREIAKRVLGISPIPGAYSSHQLPQIDLLVQALDAKDKEIQAAYKEGIAFSREEHKAGCMIAFQRGAEETKERAARAIQVLAEEMIDRYADHIRSISVSGELKVKKNE